MSQVVATDGCAKQTCVDGGHVTVRFANGELRDYCEHDARLVLRMVTGAEVVNGD